MGKSLKCPVCETLKFGTETAFAPLKIVVARKSSSINIQGPDPAIDFRQTDPLARVEVDEASHGNGGCLCG